MTGSDSVTMLSFRAQQEICIASLVRKAGFLPEPALPVRCSLDVGGSEDAKTPRFAQSDRGEGVEMTI
jgi:hypothetical protein